MEPAWRHLPHTEPGTMVAYRESDIKLYWTARDKDEVNLRKVIEFARKIGSVSDVDEVEDNETGGSTNGLAKRSVETVNTTWGSEDTLNKTRCSLLLVADYRLARTNS
jgi:hypothetical protein